MDQDDIIYEIFPDLECPFTWDMSQYPNKIDYALSHDEMFVPSITFMRYIMSAYDKTEKLEFVKAEETLQEAEKVILKLERSAIEVAEHIFDSTNVHFLMKKGKSKDKVKKILKNIKSVKGDIYDSQLNVFKACAWSLGIKSTFSLNIAINFARLSIEKDQEAATAHFLLAKNLRCKRRTVSVFKIPDEEEIHHFTKAYELSKNPQFGLFLAQLRKESRDQSNALTIFKEIYEMNIESASIQLRLALAFTQMKCLEFANKCLDYVESVTPNDSMFLHYKGLFFMKKKEYEKAAPYLMKAGLENNYGADVTYAKCMRKLGKRFDFPGYFINLLDKYSDSENPRKQNILLHVGFSFYWIKRDLREAVKYFLLAFEIDAEGDILENYHDPLTDESLNVYRFLKEELLPKIESYRDSKVISLNEETILATNRLQKFFEEYKARRILLRNLENKIETNLTCNDSSAP